jgi:hypothetical protein
MTRRMNRRTPGPDWGGFYEWVDPIRLGPVGRAALGSDRVGPWPGAIPGLTPDSWADSRGSRWVGPLERREDEES